MMTEPRLMLMIMSHILIIDITTYVNQLHQNNKKRIACVYGCFDGVRVCVCVLCVCACSLSGLLLRLFVCFFVCLCVYVRACSACMILRMQTPIFHTSLYDAVSQCINGQH